MQLISPHLYVYAYLIFATIFTFIYVNDVYKKDIGKTFAYRISALLILLFFVFFIGLRPVNAAFVDMVAYNDYYSMSARSSFSFDGSYENVLFDNLMSYMASIFSDSTLFFLLIAAIYYIGMFVACKRIFPQNYIIAFLMCVAAFSAFNYATNGIKAGAAASIFLMAYAYKDKRLLSAALALISLGFHHAMILVVIAYVVSLFVKKTKWYFYVWSVCVILSVLHISYFQFLFGGLADERGQSYLLVDSSTDGYMTGFRPDFILYSMVPVVIGYIVIVRQKTRDEVYEFLLRNYLLINSVWMLCMYASFTARIAYLSWFVYPIVLIYPFLSVNGSLKSGEKAKRVVLYHLSFTLFMEFIFYNFIKL